MKQELQELETWQKIGIACLLIVISGFVGWLVEFTYYFIDRGIFHWMGGNFLPWINIYSIGVFIVLGRTYKFRKKPIYVFLMSSLSAGLLELLTGVVLFRVFGIRYWDYGNKFLSLNGYICFDSLLLMGLGGMFLVYFALPKLTELSKRQPKKTFLTISVTLFILVFSDEVYNFLITKLFDLPRAIDIYRSLLLNAIF